MKEEKHEYLALALQAVSGPRQRDYGHPLPNLLIICLLQNIWDAGRRVPDDYITPLDSDILNILQKIAREQNTHKDDNFVDIIGYSDLIDRCDAYMKELGYPDGIESFRTMNLQDMFDLLLKTGPTSDFYTEWLQSRDR